MKRRPPFSFIAVLTLLPLPLFFLPSLPSTSFYPAACPLLILQNTSVPPAGPACCVQLLHETQPVDPVTPGKRCAQLRVGGLQGDNLLNQAITQAVARFRFKWLGVSLGETCVSAVLKRVADFDEAGKIWIQTEGISVISRGALGVDSVTRLAQGATLENGLGQDVVRVGLKEKCTGEQSVQPQVSVRDIGFLIIGTNVSESVQSVRRFFPWNEVATGTDRSALLKTLHSRYIMELYDNLSLTPDTRLGLLLSTLEDAGWQIVGNTVDSLQAWRYKFISELMLEREEIHLATTCERVHRPGGGWLARREFLQELEWGGFDGWNTDEMFIRLMRGAVKVGVCQSELRGEVHEAGGVYGGKRLCESWMRELGDVGGLVVAGGEVDCLRGRVCERVADGHFENVMKCSTW